MRQPELRIGGPAGQHQRGADLIGGELIRNSHARQAASRADTAQPDFDHGGHQPGPLVIHLPILCPEHLHTVITRQPRQLNSSEDARQLGTRRKGRQVPGNQLPNRHEQHATTHHRQQRELVLTASA